MRRLLWWAAVTTMGTAVAWTWSFPSRPVGLAPLRPAGAQDGLGPTRRKKERIRAPTLDGGVAWFNTRAPITLESLRGKIVLLDFWTFG